MKGPIPAQAQLEAKMQPAQQRATETYERILEVTALTLADVGIERLSTNLVCRRAGLSPPALYRYFPNKYALLSVLGQRLMLRQNERVERWISAPALQASRQTLEQALRGLILDTHEVTRETAGGGMDHARRAGAAGGAAAFTRPGDRRADPAARTGFSSRASRPIAVGQPHRG